MENIKNKVDEDKTMEISIKQIQEAEKAGYEHFVIINGEHYKLKEVKTMETKELNDETLKELTGETDKEYNQRCKDKEETCHYSNKVGNSLCGIDWSSCTSSPFMKDVNCKKCIKEVLNNEIIQ